MSHLSDLELAEAVAGARTPRADAHLSACATCRREFDLLAADIHSLRTDHVRRVPAEPFWMKQRAGVRRRLDEPRRGHPLVAAGALVAAALVLAAGLPPRTDAGRAGTARPGPTVVADAAPSAPRVEAGNDALLLEAETLVAAAPTPLTGPIGEDAP